MKTGARRVSGVFDLGASTKADVAIVTDSRVVQALVCDGLQHEREFARELGNRYRTRAGEVARRVHGPLRCVVLFCDSGEAAVREACAALEAECAPKQLAFVGLARATGESQNFGDVFAEENQGSVGPLTSALAKQKDAGGGAFTDWTKRMTRMRNDLFDVCHLPHARDSRVLHLHEHDRRTLVARGESPGLLLAGKVKREEASTVTLLGIWNGTGSAAIPDENLRHGLLKEHAATAAVTALTMLLDSVDDAPVSDEAALRWYVKCARSSIHDGYTDLAAKVTGGDPARLEQAIGKLEGAGFLRRHSGHRVSLGGRLARAGAWIGVRTLSARRYLGGRVTVGCDGIDYLEIVDLRPVR